MSAHNILHIQIVCRGRMRSRNQEGWAFRQSKSSELISTLSSVIIAFSIRSITARPSKYKIRLNVDLQQSGLLVSIRLNAFTIIIK